MHINDWWIHCCINYSMPAQNDMCIEWHWTWMKLVDVEKGWTLRFIGALRFWSSCLVCFVVVVVKFQPKLDFHLALSFGNLILHVFVYTFYIHIDCISHCLVSHWIGEYKRTVIKYSHTHGCFAFDKLSVCVGGRMDFFYIYVNSINGIGAQYLKIFQNFATKTVVICSVFTRCLIF